MTLGIFLDTAPPPMKPENLDAEPIDIFNEICVKRGFLMKGGEYDYARCSKAIIDDFRKGRTGKVVLD